MSFFIYCMLGFRGGQGVRTPLKDHKNVGFLSNTGPDLPKITKLPSNVPSGACIPLFKVGP